MCTAVNYLQALEKEIELRLNGYQTCVAVPDYIGPKEYADEFGTHIKHVYELKESDRTNASFEDICRSFEKTIECYQVPEQEVPKAQLLPENLLSVFTSEVQFDSITKKKRLCLALDKKIKDKHLLCLPPSTIQIAAEISAMEHVSGIRANLSKIVRNEVDSFEERHAIPEVIPPALQALLQSENIQLPPFAPQILDDAEYEILKDNNRPGIDWSITEPDYVDILVGKRRSNSLRRSVSTAVVSKKHRQFYVFFSRLIIGLLCLIQMSQASECFLSPIKNSQYRCYLYHILSSATVSSHVP